MPHVLITGANRGIGLALARTYLARGAAVTATVRDPAKADALAGLGGSPNPVDIRPLDVTKSESCEALADALAGRPLDVLVCNAGRLEGRGRIEDPAYTERAWIEQLMTNVAGVFFTVRALAPALKRGTSPRIAVISSVMGSSARAPGGTYAYRASKAAAVNLARNLAADLAADGIAVGVYHPGWVRTDMGGPSADIDAEESARGLVARIDALSLATTGVFEDHRGQAIPF